MITHLISHEITKHDGFHLSKRFKFMNVLFYEIHLRNLANYFLLFPFVSPFFTSKRISFINTCIENFQFIYCNAE